MAEVAMLVHSRCDSPWHYVTGPKAVKINGLTNGNVLSLHYRETAGDSPVKLPQELQEGVNPLDDAPDGMYKVARVVGDSSLTVSIEC